MDAVAADDQVIRDAEAICGGGDTDVATVATLARALRKRELHDLVARMLVTVARRALYHGWAQPDWPQLAAVLRTNQQFGYARRLFRRLHEANPDDLEVRRQYAFCVYKDAELPAARRLDRALDILCGAGPLRESRDSETLGIGGAIYKRKWDVEARRGDLEKARFCYALGYQQTGHPEREYCGINAAFVLDRLASLDADDELGDPAQATTLRAEATRIRDEIVDTITKRRADGGELPWDAATLGEAYFGLERFDEAAVELRAVRERDPAPWELETTAAQIAALARMRDLGADPQTTGAARATVFWGSDAGKALRALVGDDEAALRRAYLGKVGLALSGGGFRASLFHIGVLAKLAEHNMLRRVEVLSCVSGGSILGAFYYLRLRELLQRTEDGKVEDTDYVELVRRLALDFQDSVKRNLRVRLTEDLDDNWKMMATEYSRTNRVSELLQELIYSRIDNGGKPWRMTDLFINPAGRGRGFSPRYENWRRSAKVPILVLNATTLNTGHNWQFTASWMGEPPVVGDEQVDANPRFRRMYYSDAPDGYKEVKLADAVAASACVPALFPPLKLAGLFKAPGPAGGLEEIDVELVDGGVHDNQGVASLLEQDCSVVLVSDASGQLGDLHEPKRGVLGVAGRSNSILMSRVRGAQYNDLWARQRAGSLRRMMIVHLKKGLPVRPLDWLTCPEPYDPEQDEIPDSQNERRAAYRIDEGVQRGLAGLRTDLDAFSDGEAHALMAAGYRMTEYELAQGLPDFPQPDAPLQPQGGWPFAAALDVIAKPGALKIPLEVGSERFGRGVRAWLAGRREKPKGALARAVDRTGLPKLPGAAGRVADTVVVRPLRAAASAPAALAGALATRGYLGLFGRRRDGD
jgi:predicted acylesterase/phospholipase RssA